jgi:rhodanese-related sulfurtransferase
MEFSGVIVFIVSFLIFQFFMMSKSLDLSTDTQILKSINIDEAAKLIEEGINIIDVRTPGEFSGKTLKNSKNCDIYNNKFKENMKKFDINKKYLIYCQTGNRSKSALKIAKTLGFKEMYELKGGISLWLRNNNSVTSPKPKKVKSS